MQPLFYAALAFAGGIAAAAAGPAWLAPFAVLWLAVVSALAAVLLRRRAAAAVLALLVCAALGGWRARQVLAAPAAATSLERAARRLQTTPRSRIFLTGYLRDTPELLWDRGQPSAIRLDLAAVTLAPYKASARVAPVSGGVRLYAYPPVHPPRGARWQAALLRLRAGDGLGASVHLRPLPRYRDPGVADFAAAARRQGIALTATLPLEGWQPWPAVGGGVATRLRAAIWRGLSRRLDQLVPPRAAPRANALLRGMLLGDVARLDDATRTDFQIDGVYHLLVVAGLHIGILAALLYWLCRRLRLPPLAASAVTLLLLAAYAWDIAGRTPTLRALLMLALYFGARVWYRERQALNAVGGAGLILLVWHPLDLFAPGFELSLGAATLLAGIALPLLLKTSHPLRRAIRQLANPGYDEAFPPRLAQWRLDLRSAGWPRLLPVLLRILLAVYDVIVISLVLQLGFAAFNVVYFHRASPWSVVANALLVPAAGVLIPLAWLALAASSIGAFTVAAGALLAAAARGLLAVAAALARWPLANWRAPSPPGWFLVVFAAAVAAWLVAAGRWAGARPSPPKRVPAPGPEPPQPPMRGWQPFAAITGIMAICALVVSLAPFPPRLPPGLAATILDVGQGDSILVSFPDGRTMLVDAGPRSAHWDSGEEIVAPFLWSLGLHRLDAVLLTHAHNDHLGGMATVVRDFHPGEIWLSRSLPSRDPALRSFLRLVRKPRAGRPVKIRRLAAGDAFLAGASRLAVLLPPPNALAGPKPSNDDSLMLRVSWGGAAMLLAGDAQAAGESWLLRQHEPLASAVLKVGHHGSNSSSSAAFLAAVRPQVAVISAGRANLYGLPSPAVLARLRQAGARVFRTDRSGAIQCRLQGGWLRVLLFRRPPA